mgnify:CR=1 FL=1
MDMNVAGVAADLVQAAMPVQPVVRLVGEGESATVPAKGETTKPEQVEAAGAQSQHFTPAVTQKLKFFLYEGTGKKGGKIVGVPTPEGIRQIPSEEAIKIAGALGKIQGLLFNGEA